MFLCSLFMKRGCKERAMPQLESLITTKNWTRRLSEDVTTRPNYLFGDGLRWNEKPKPFWSTEDGFQIGSKQVRFPIGQNGFNNDHG